VERTLLLDAFDSGWVAPVGPHLPAFEAELAEATGVPHAVAVSSGTAALHLGLLLAGVQPGDEVLVPSFTFAASANVVTYVGAQPVFVDCSSDTWTIDVDLVAEELARRAGNGRLPGAVLPVDIYGQCADYDALLAVCAGYGVPVVEDAAEALGASYRGRPAGSFGTVAAASFNGNKIITCGGGGALLTADGALAERARHLATQAREPAPHYEHRDIGFNYRLSNLLAAIGRGQLSTLGERVRRRQEIFRCYAAALADLPGVTMMPLAGYGQPNCWLSCLQIDADEFGAGPDQLRRHLESLDIEARPVWKPMHLQPVFSGRQMISRAGGDGIVCERLFARGLCLPSGTDLDAADLDRVIDAVHEVPLLRRAISA
jgi:dTDP-4-amino-4,6-dideoxygalactose transaminase